eukprot:Phypoly_transcript_08787.p1 GENE.Phypoly_transcript_08787~~Phypoly_transcript_08787.p1  ORF type:complete len:391 (+),score=66.47 Phypoly_transcript_08787:177-1349(+)
MAKSPTDKAVDAFLLELGSPPATAKKQSSKEEELAKKKKALEDLKAKPAPVSSDISDSEKKEKALEHETSLLSISDSSSGSSSSSRSAKMEELLRRKAAAEASIRSVSEGKISFVPSTGSSSRVAELEEKKARYSKELSELPSTKELLAEKDSASAKLDRLERGIDVCFLMDCTGSMGSFISAAKEKILEIITKVETIEPTSIMRVSFVGYRDYGDGALQHEKVDFVEKASMEVIRTKLAACPATGGGDGPEDIAGGLKIVTELSWSSSTRLLIHFGDYPCHGNKYHGTSMGDFYPAGDPGGLVPEDLLRVVMKKRIDYYFMKITNYTDQMIAIFQAVYPLSPQKRKKPKNNNNNNFIKAFEPLIDLKKQEKRYTRIQSHQMRQTLCQRC